MIDPTILAFSVPPAQLFEAGMLVCFGASWPVAIVKTLRTRRTEGKSLTFLVLVAVGYLSGTIAKLVLALDAGAWPVWVTYLYALNGAMVCTDIALYMRYRPGSTRPNLGEPILP